jgi:hypothetical protein
MHSSVGDFPPTAVMAGIAGKLAVFLPTLVIKLLSLSVFIRSNSAKLATKPAFLKWLVIWRSD